MKKILITTAIFGTLLIGNNAMAQTPVGTLVPNFTLTDITGTTHSLYQYLDQGKTVVIDISAIWCGPCWSYHNTNALENFYAAHGPAGADDAMVFFLEGDASTSSACLYAPGPCAGGTSQGDWVTGATHPIFNLSSSEVSLLPLDISYYPVMYVICPNRTVYKSGTAGSIGTLSLLNSYMGDCTLATSGLNAALNSYTGSIETPCGNTGNAKVILQNMGTDTLTSCTITATVGATTIGPINWTGTLLPYYYQTVTLGTFTVSSPSTMNISITTTDVDMADNSLAPFTVSNNEAADMNITLQFITDAYGSETTWELRNGAFALINSGGPYNDLGIAGTTTQTPVNLTLPADCYTLKVYDSGLNGMDCGYGAGSYTVKNGTTTLLTGAKFYTSSVNRKFSTLGGITVEEIEEANGLTVFPNPVNNIATVAIETSENSDIEIIIANSVGQVMAIQRKYNVPVGMNKFELDFSSFSEGVYFLTAKSGTKTNTTKIIK